jgi:hypothetical protein
MALLIGIVAFIAAGASIYIGIRMDQRELERRSRAERAEKTER